ncbi:DUF6541 family protein [Amycolatopsis nigrescens]|uniref:DUF6541 family protein n=1 Tax=Amycolatopsis nigrescens TaxID=381445 RepID=UPI0003827974|nr:DUF6541 family protein [Amycolatopsis nigrescens]
MSLNAVTILVYLLVLLLPGAVAGAAAGLRGWVLAGTAPLLTYAIGGLAGPWLAAVGLPFNGTTFAVCTALFAAVGFGLRLLAVRRFRARHDGESPGAPPLWARSGHFAVLACLIVAGAVGAYAVLRGLGQLDAIAQGWDAVYHANGIRYIADTGDGSLVGTSHTNWYGAENELFYPNAYHLISALGFQLTGATIPAILNTNTLLLPFLLALSLVALVREFRGRAVHAGAVALVAVAPAMGLYESMDRGPLLPFLLGVALTPLGAVALHRYLQRPSMDTGFVFALAVVGLLTVHSSTLFAGILFALPMLIQRWVTGENRWRTAGRDLLALLVAGAASAVVAGMQLLGALGLASSEVPYYGWDNEGWLSGAIGTLFAFQHVGPRPQVWLGAALFLGLLFFNRLNGLRWIGGTALLSGLLYVAVSSTNDPLVMAISRPWWDDPFRFVTMATVPLCVLAAHGLAEVQAWVRDRLPFARERAYSWVAAGLAVLVLAGFAGLTEGLYYDSNARMVYGGYNRQDKHNMPVSPDEAQAMLELGKRAKPGEWAMNDRNDGTVWTYAISGVRTVSGHYDGTLPPAEAILLGDHFREYETNQAVRDTVRKLNVRWVIVGHGGFAEVTEPLPGLVGLDRLDFLEPVYRNQDSQVYRLIPEPGEL